MPYSDKEVDDFWASIDEAASNAPKAPYSHAKVIELIRVACKLKSQNAKLIQQLADQQAELERLKAVVRDQMVLIERLKAEIERLRER